MEMLNGLWLLHEIDRSAKKPVDKLLSLYTCLNSWVLAPGNLEIIAKNSTDALSLVETPVLQTYLIDLATQAKIPHPEIYVSQMFILLRGAIAEELRYPGTGALLRAQDAAKAVMETVKPKPMARVKSYVLVGSSLALAVPLFLIAFGISHFSSGVNTPLIAQRDSVSPVKISSITSPALISEVIALKEDFDAGNCPAPQLLNIPPEQVEAYIDVIEIRVLDNPALNNYRLRSFLNWYDHYMARECYFKSENKQKTILGMGK